jgi:hypothetical protein
MNLTPLKGMLVRLETARDMQNSYCTSLTTIKVEGERARLCCAHCGRHRKWLSPGLAKWLLTILEHFPAAKDEPVVIRDEDYENPEHDKFYRAHFSRFTGKRGSGKRRWRRSFLTRFSSAMSTAFPLG